MERSHELAQGTNTSPGHIGDGYRVQLANMQENERVKSIAMQKYTDSVGSPTRQKQLQAEYATESQVQDRASLQNQRAQMAQEYHQRIRNEHK